MQRRPERISSLNVESGLYVLRYLDGSATDHPVIFVRSSPGCDDLVDIIAVPGEVVGRLASPGAIAVIVAKQPATVQITAQAASANGSLNAEVSLEPLTRGRDGAAKAPERTAVSAQASIAEPVASARNEGDEIWSRADGASGLGLLAHVSRRGDVASSDAVWIGGPDAPAPIEGVALDCPASLGSVRYQVLAAGDTRWSDWLTNGVFGGSRGRAKPLTGVRIRFDPAEGSSASLNGEALFLGSAIIRKDGLDLEFRSAAGLDPLVGLKLSIARQVPAAMPGPGNISTAPQHGRVRVFKASSRRTG